MKPSHPAFVGTLLLALLIPCLVAAESGEISPRMIDQFRQDLEKRSDLSRIVNAATNNDLKALSLNRDIVAGHDSRFNFEINGTKIIDQKSSGRCWMFAGANVITPKVMNLLKLSDFKLSESYLGFWDKMEKSNLYLETMIEMRDRDINDRALQMYIDSPIGDGGWWEYFQALIAKHGLVTSTAMPETKQSSSTGRLNRLVSSLLRKATAEIRRRHEAGDKVNKLREYKKEVLGDLYTMLVCTYGQPPEKFVFRYEDEVDDSTKVLVEKEYTSKSFYEEYYGDQTPEFVPLVHNPNKEYGKLYRFDGGRNVFEATDMSMLNLPIEKLKAYARKAILDSVVVWFACDVGWDNFNDSGIFAVDVYDYSSTFGLDLRYSKADRLLYNDMSTNHAMALVGVDTTTSGEVRKWRVENSWGADKGNSGYWTMYDNWFDEYVLLVMVDKSALEPDEKSGFEQDPIIIEDWEPFFRSLTNIR